MRIIFFSDTHLHRDDAPKTAYVRDFVHSVCRSADAVAILGDLFEFFFGYRNYVYAWYRPVIDSLSELVAQGKRVYFIEGNHEYNMKGIEEATGILCARELSLDIEGKKTYLCHGDTLVSPLLPSLIKSPPILFLMDRLGPSLTWQIAMLFRIVLSRKTKPYNARAKRALREQAKQRFSQEYDVVIFGHSHVPDRITYGSGPTSRIYLNTGDLSQYGSYVEYSSTAGFRLRTFRPR